MVTDPERERSRKRLHEWAQRSAKLWRAVPGRMIDTGEIPAAVHEAREAGVEAAFEGGAPDAERVQVCFHPAEEEPAFTARWVTASWDARFSSPGHRDLMGSLMGLGIDRSLVGDLVCMDGRACLYCMPELAERLPVEWREAGHTPLKVRVEETPPAIVRPSGERVRITVASARLDAVLSGGLRVSRAAAAEMIRGGDVRVDHALEERIDTILSAGTVLSVRGWGRLIVRELGAETRKGRIPVELEVLNRGTR